VNKNKILNGDWGLGIGDWAQSPIPNPQSPFILLKFFPFQNNLLFIVSEIISYLKKIIFIY
jgi:hypothetical protein